MVREGAIVAGLDLENLKSPEEFGRSEKEATGSSSSSNSSGGQQLSSEKANGSSRNNSGNRTTEMAQEDNNPCWNNLPSVILLEIFSYLPHEDRIRTSQVCRNWRYALFHPSFWKKITFTLDGKPKNNNNGARFLINCFGRSVREATIRWDNAPRCLNEASMILTKLSANSDLRRLFLETGSWTFNLPTSRGDSKDERQTMYDNIIRPLVKITETTNCLEALSLGCDEDVTTSAIVILEPLRNHHAKHLTHLSLASVKEDPDDYALLELDTTVFGSFVRLSVLTLDYDYVSDVLLKTLDSGLMERLVIHVHGIIVDHPGTTDNAWLSFVEKNPRCELRLSVLESYDAVPVLHSDILRPAMPLTHLKVLFCGSVNVRALDQMSGWYPATLKSVVWIDSLDFMQQLPITYYPNRPDPLILLAWTCPKLVEIVFMGYKYFHDDLLAIVRLRGSTLKRLEFASRDIIFENHNAQAINQEIRQIMGDCWHPLGDEELPTVVLDPRSSDTADVIMPMVLRDQK